MVDSERDFFTEAVTSPLQLPCFDLVILSKQNFPCGAAPGSASAALR